MRIAVRSLLKTPLVTLVAVLSLALGIGANTAMFSLTDHVLLRLMPLPDAGQLVAIYQPGPVQGRISSSEDNQPVFSYPMFRELQKRRGPLGGVAGSRDFDANLAYGGRPTPASGMMVSGNYFPLLGVRPAMGRLIEESDDITPGAHGVAVLGHKYWLEQLGANPAVLNQKLLVNGHPMTIVGVAERGFRGERQGSEPPDVYVPITMKAQVNAEWFSLEGRKDHWVYLLGRMPRGMTIEQAASGINVPYKALLQEEVKLLDGSTAQMRERFLAKSILLKPAGGGRGSFRDDARPSLYLLLAITAAVLLIACANIANIMLARAAGRTREIAVRLAIGAGRRRITELLLREALLVAAAGGVLALLVARWTVDLIVSAVPELQVIGAGSIHQRALVYTVGITLFTVLLFGLYPAWKASRLEVNGMLKEQSGQASSSGASSRLRRALVAAQAALSLALLIISGLAARDLVNIAQIEFGMNPHNLVTFTMDPSLNKYDRTQSVAAFRRVTESLERIPGVSPVTLSSVSLLTGDSWVTPVQVPGYVRASENEMPPNFASVGPRFFATLGVALRSGREFSDGDVIGRPRVAMVNETFALSYYKTLDVLGKTFTTFRNSKEQITIVGVAKDFRLTDPKARQARPVFYLPYLQNDQIGALHFYLRTQRPADQTIEEIRKTVRAVEPSLPVRDPRTMDTVLSRELTADWLISGLAIGCGALASLLAAVGLFGVLAYSVTRRMREIGIRIAFGARPADITGLVLRETARMFGAGAVFGLPLGWAAAKLIEGEFYGVDGGDPLVFGAALILLALIALAAALTPARRAAYVDPIHALRAD